jgi:hypothetical protein
MPFRALSERVKAQNKVKLKEAKLRQAVAAYHHEQGKPEGSRKGARTIAQEFGIDGQWRTIVNRYKGGRSQGEANEEKQKLTPAEEALLASFILESADHGFPRSLRDIENYANLIQQGRLGNRYKAVGESWAARFLDRHRDLLQTHWSKPLDTQRARAMNPEAKKKWFELLEKFVIDAGILPENLYAMDETGCPPSNQGTERVVGGRGVKTQHKQGGADRENVTALVTICADGSVLRPTIIFKGQNFMTGWAQDNVSNAS